MKKLLPILFPAVFAMEVFAQPSAKPDTTYNIQAEYQKHLKTYPGLSMVKSLERGSIQQKKNVVYQKTGDRKLMLDVFSPKNTSGKSRTAIIMIHGGGWRSGNRAMHYPMAQRLANLGYVCITPEYRLSAEAIYPAAIHDIKVVIRWVRKNAKDLKIDPSRIAVAGHSAGGELAAFMGATNGMKAFEGNGDHLSISSEVNAIIDMDGILAFIHPESGEGDDSKRISAATQWFGFSKTAKPGLWKEASPLTHVGQHTPPTLFINSGVARMHAGRDDFIAILNKHTIYSEVKTFEGSPHSFVLFNPWFDSTIILMNQFLGKVFKSQNKSESISISVAKDGTGDFSTIQSAFDVIPYSNDQIVEIKVKKGEYREKVLLDSTKRRVRLLGEDKMETIIAWNDHTGKIAPGGDTINTRTSWTCKIKAGDFQASNITFINDAGYSAGQAVALESDGDRSVFINCRFIGNQDVLFLNNENSRQLFEKCYIEGTTDFIFGSATAWFEKCEIFGKKNSHITAASTPSSKKWGFVFNDCHISGDSTLRNISLGRPWRPYAAVVYLNCYIGPQIKAEGWSNWNNTENYKTARYAEYKNYGPSSDPAKRVNWSKQLTDEEAKSYSLKSFREGWFPEN